MKRLGWVNWTVLVVGAIAVVLAICFELVRNR